MNLFQINQDIENLLSSSINPRTGEITNESFEEELKALQLNKQEKQKNAILYYKNVKAEEDILDAEIKRLNELKTFCRNKQEKLKEIIAESLGDAPKVDFVTCGAIFKKNPHTVIVEDEEQLKDYTRVEIVTKLDKKAICKAIKEGKEVKGARLERKIRLDIY